MRRTTAHELEIYLSWQKTIVPWLEMKSNKRHRSPPLFSASQEPKSPSSPGRTFSQPFGRDFSESSPVSTSFFCFYTANYLSSLSLLSLLLLSRRNDPSLLLVVKISFRPTLLLPLFRQSQLQLLLAAEIEPSALSKYPSPRRRQTQSRFPP